MKSAFAREWCALKRKSMIHAIAGGAAIAAALAGIFLYPAQCGEGVRRGLMMCGSLVIPSLFPFMALCEFIGYSGWSARLGRWASPVTRRLFGIRAPVGAAVVMGFIGGYPVGARSTAALYRDGMIGREEARRMLCFCVNGGPAFVMSAVGVGMLRSPATGWLLLLVHWLSSLLLGAGLGRIWSRRPPRDWAEEGPIADVNPGRRMSLSEAFVEGTASASSGMFSICAFVILFSGVLSLLGALPLREGTVRVLSALLETTSGCREMAAVGAPLPLISAALGFGGICVHFQVLSCAGEFRPRLPLFLLCRAAHAGLSYLLCSLAVRLIPGTVPAISNAVNPVFAGMASTVPASAALLCTAAVLLLCPITRPPDDGCGRFMQ